MIQSYYLINKYYSIYQNELTLNLKVKLVIHFICKIKFPKLIQLMQIK